MASAITPSLLRNLVLKFYSENDPIKLQQGLDINGIVEWTMKNGVDKLNAMLLKQFGKIIDVNGAMEDARAQFSRMSAALTPNLFIQSKALSNNITTKQQQITKKLERFYRVHDETRLTEENRDQFDRIVAFALYHGIDKLNVKLEKKYNDALPLEDEDEEEDDRDLGEAEIIYAVDKKDVDMIRLEDDLYMFLKEKKASELNVIDQIVDWVLRMGFEEFNQKSEQMFGDRFDDFLVANDKEPYAEASKKAYWEQKKKDEEAEKKRLEAIKQKKLEDEEAEKLKQQQEEEAKLKKQREEELALAKAAATSKTTVLSETTNEERPFDQMTDKEIMRELTAFYEVYDADNMGKLPDVLNLAKKLGRDQLNERLLGLYEDKLHPDLKYDKIKFSDGESSMGMEGGDVLAEIGKQEEFTFNESTTNIEPNKFLAEVPNPISQRMNPPPAVAPRKGSLVEVGTVGPTLPPRKKSTTQEEKWSHKDEVEPTPKAMVPPTPDKKGILGGFSMRIMSSMFGVKRVKEAEKKDVKREEVGMSILIPSEKKKGSIVFPKTTGKAETIEEIMQRAKEIKARNVRGESIITGFDGIKEIVNILKECEMYEFNVISGVCARCGMPKNQHSAMAKKPKVNEGIDDSQLYNAKGAPNVAALVNRVNQKGKHVPAKRFLENLKLARTGPKNNDELTLLASASMRLTWKGQQP